MAWTVRGSNPGGETRRLLSQPVQMAHGSHHASSAVGNMGHSRRLRGRGLAFDHPFPTSVEVKKSLEVLLPLCGCMACYGETFTFNVSVTDFSNVIAIMVTEF